MEVSFVKLRYCKGGNVKGKHFHTPLYKAVPLSNLRFVVGGRVKETRLYTQLFKAVPQTKLRYEWKEE